MTDSRPASRVLELLRQAREQRKLTPEDVDERLILGPGWTRLFESGDIVPSVDMFLALTRALDVSPGLLFDGFIAEGSPP